jgi:hypothetical protein
VDGAASARRHLHRPGQRAVGHYAEFGADPESDPAAGFQPDFAFVRYLGHRLEPTVPEKDRRWVIDQVMAAEHPRRWPSCSARCATCSTPRRAARGARALSGD